VPLIDASGAEALKRFIRSAAGKGTAIVICEILPGPEAALRSQDIAVPMAATLSDAIVLARSLAEPVIDRQAAYA